MFGCAAVVNVPVKKLAVVKLPKLALAAVILPLAIKVLAEITLTLLTLPPEPDVTILPTVALPVTVKLLNVPTLVRDELTMVLFNVVPVKLAALDVIATAEAAVSWP